jgi:hypothetical protein
MLDVHPPHAPTHTWRDFLTHIATIVIGLLIAVGLEQTVEWLHHRHQLAETRAALRAEREKNSADIDGWVLMIRREHAALDNNLLVLSYLRQHPGTPASKLPGVLTWHSGMNAISTSAWTTASQSSALTLMPDDEVRKNGTYYEHIRLINTTGQNHWKDLNDARLYSFADPDPTHMTPLELDQSIDRTKRALESLYLCGVTVINLKDDFPDIAKGLTPDDINSIPQAKQSEYSPDLAAPLAQTIQRIDAAGKLRDYFPQSTPPAQ